MKEIKQTILSSMPQSTQLKTLDNPHTDRDYTISLHIPDLTCLCPIDHHPSFAKLTIEYVPDASCIEVNSLKQYIESLRNVALFQEDIINQIRDQLAGVLAPRYLSLSAEFSPIHGISMHIHAEYHKKDWLPDQLRLPQPAKLLDKPL